MSYSYDIDFSFGVTKISANRWMIGFYLPLPYPAIARNPVESYYVSRTRQPAVGLFRCERSMTKKGAYEKDSGFNLAVIVFTRRSINDTLAICRVDTRLSILRPRDRNDVPVTDLIILR